MRENRLLYMDRYPTYQAMLEELNNDQTPSNQFDFEKFTVNMTVYSRHVHCLNFVPQPDVGQSWHQARQLDQLIAEKSPSEYYFFFWVEDDSFELFREVRQYLWDKEFEVGWRPITERSPLRFCNGTTGSLSFQPQ